MSQAGSAELPTLVTQKRTSLTEAISYRIRMDLTGQTADPMA